MKPTPLPRVAELRRRLKAKGLKMSWASVALRVHPTTLRRWFSGRIARPSEARLDALEALIEAECDA